MQRQTIISLNSPVSVDFRSAKSSFPVSSLYQRAISWRLRMIVILRKSKVKAYLLSRAIAEHRNDLLFTSAKKTDGISHLFRVRLGIEVGGRCDCWSSHYKQVFASILNDLNLKK